MKKGLTEIVFILDRSGSMADMVSDTLGGFNSMIRKQKKLEGEALVSTVLFNSESRVIHDRVPIESVNDLTEEDYIASGCTALIDAIGCAIKHISTVHKYIRKEDAPERTLFVITTDGLENASHIYSSRQVKNMIEQKKEAGWDFLFLGANIDAVETAGSIGISREYAANYHNDTMGVRKNFKAVDEVIYCMRSTPGKSLSKAWKKTIDEDFESRKQK